MATSILSLITSACRRTNLPVPSSLVTSPTDAALQYLENFYQVGEDLLSRGPWPQLKKTHTFTTTATDEYALPSDFWTFSLDTQWDTTNHWKLRPQTDAGFNEELYWFGPSSNRTSFRIFGSSATGAKKPFIINPVNSGLDFSFDYISNSYIYDATGATAKSTVSVDTDITVFPDTLIIAGWRYYWLDKKGQDTTATYDLYERLIARTMSKDFGPLKSSRSPRFDEERFFNTTDGDWNV